jgi:hypothetical protein
MGACHRNMEVYEEETWSKITSSQEVEDILASCRTCGHILLTHNYGSLAVLGCPLYITSGQTAEKHCPQQFLCYQSTFLVCLYVYPPYCC